MYYANMIIVWPLLKLDILATLLTVCNSSDKRIICALLVCNQGSDYYVSRCRIFQYKASNANCEKVSSVRLHTVYLILSFLKKIEKNHMLFCPNPAKKLNKMDQLKAYVKVYLHFG